MALQTITLTATPTTLDPGGAGEVYVRNLGTHPVTVSNGGNTVKINPGKDYTFGVLGAVTAWVTAPDGGAGSISFDVEGSAAGELTAQQQNAVTTLAATKTVSAVNITGAATIDATRASVVVATLTGNVSGLTITGASTTNAELEVHFVQDATGSRTLGTISGVKWAGGTAPTWATAAGARDVIGFRPIGGVLFELRRSLNVH